MLQPKREKIICFRCKKPITGARTVINEQWHCADCTYLIDHPNAVIPERPKRTRVKKQEETLFPLPPVRGSSS